MYSHDALNDAYGQWLLEYEKNGWSIYYTNIMFNPLRGPVPAILAQMRVSVENEFYPMLCNRLHRHPGRKSAHDRLPRLFLFPDKKTFKYLRTRHSNITINSSLHYNGFVLIPPRVRLKIGFPDHIKSLQSIYARGPIQRVHSKEVTYDHNNIAGYARKTLKYNHALDEHRIILPRESRDRRPQQIDPVSKALKDIQSATNCSDDVAKAVIRKSSGQLTRI